MENWTASTDVLRLMSEALKVTPQSSLPAFILLLFCYIFIMLSHVGVVVLIFCNSSLHQPIYLLLCDMMVNDAFGATITLPHLLKDLLLSSSKRYIQYWACTAQAFCVHLHASVSHTGLVIMGVDRYMAICSPLRYAAVMTHRTVTSLSWAAWASTCMMVGILVGLSVRLPRCRQMELSIFCDNASLFSLSCESVLINNVYGLVYTVLLLGSSMVSVGLTYLKIVTVCLRSRKKALNSKALQTCTTHLAVYLMLLVSGFIIVIMHRFPQLSDHRKVTTVLGNIALPALNVLIYGLQIKEIWQKVFAVFNKKVFEIDVK